MTIPAIEQAIERVAAERSSVCDELASFERFRETGWEAPIMTKSRANRTTATANIKTIHRCYRTTITTTVGDEDLQTSLKAEFSSGLADSVLDADVLTGRLKRRLRSAANTSMTDRRSFVAVLNGEQRMPEAADDALLDIRQQLKRVPDCSVRDHAFNDVMEARNTLDRLEHRCGAVAMDRQRYVQERGDQLEALVSIPEYLNTGYPVLQATPETLARIEAKRSGTVDGRPDIDTGCSDETREVDSVIEERREDELSFTGGV
jgi:hypothetical protein